MDLSIAWWLKGLAGLAVGAAILCNLPARLWLPAEKATLKYLSETLLQTVDGSRSFKASELWQQKGAVIMAVRRPG